MRDGPAIPSPGGAVSPLLRVQHHPRRQHLLHHFATAAGRIPVEVVEDPDPTGRPSPLRCYRECVGRPALGFTHLLIVQDDVTLCLDFDIAVTRLLEKHPDRLVALFVGGAPRRSAQELRLAEGRGDDVCLMQRMDWVPTVALAWPADLAREFAQYLKRVSDVHWADDPIVGGWASKKRLEVIATVPSLVQHPDMEPSLLPNDKSAKGRNGYRTAAVWREGWSPVTAGWLA